MDHCFVFKCPHVLVSFSSLSGRIRNKAEVDEAAVDAILSLNIISAKYLKSSHNSSRWATGASDESALGVDYFAIRFFIINDPPPSHFNSLFPSLPILFFRNK